MSTGLPWGEPLVRLGTRDTALTVHEAIRRAILAGGLEPGSWVSQAELARHYGVSRGPVREALRLLEREGLIEATVNQRVRVAPLCVGDLEQVYATRIVTEALAVAIGVPRFTEADLAELHMIRHQIDERAERDRDGWNRAHRMFHAQLVRYARRARGGHRPYSSSRSHRPHGIRPDRPGARAHHHPQRIAPGHWHARPQDLTSPAFQ